MNTNINKIFAVAAVMAMMSVPARAAVGLDAGADVKVVGPSVDAGIGADVRAAVTAQAQYEARQRPASLSALASPGNATSALARSQSGLRVGASSSVSGYANLDANAASASGTAAGGVVSRVDAATDTVRVSSEIQPARFLGLFTVTMPVTVESDLSGNVKVSHPWYSFLAISDDEELRADAQARVNAVMDGLVSAGMSTSSPRFKAELVDALRTSIIGSIAIPIGPEGNAVAAFSDTKTGAGVGTSTY